MPQGGARDQNLEHLICCFFSFYGFIYIKTTYFLGVTLDHRVQCPRVGLGGQNLGHLNFFLFFFSLM